MTKEDFQQQVIHLVILVTVLTWMWCSSWYLNFKSKYIFDIYRSAMLLIHLKTKIKLHICQILISLLLYLSLSSNLSQFYFFRKDFNYWIVLYVKSFFPHTAWLRNPLPIECFPLTDDLNGFKSRIDRHLWTVGSF